MRRLRNKDMGDANPGGRNGGACLCGTSVNENQGHPHHQTFDSAGTPGSSNPYMTRATMQGGQSPNGLPFPNFAPSGQAPNFNLGPVFNVNPFGFRR